MTKIRSASAVSSAIATLLVRASVLSYELVCSIDASVYDDRILEDFFRGARNNSPPHPFDHAFRDDQARFGEDPGVVRDGGLALAQRTSQGGLSAATLRTSAATSDQHS